MATLRRLSPVLRDGRTGDRATSGAPSASQELVLVNLPALLEVYQIAHRLKVSPEFVRRLLRAKAIEAIRLGTIWRVEPASLQKFIDAHRVEVAR